MKDKTTEYSPLSPRRYMRLGDRFRGCGNGHYEIYWDADQGDDCPACGKRESEGTPPMKQCMHLVRGNIIKLHMGEKVECPLCYQEGENAVLEQEVKALFKQVRKLTRQRANSQPPNKTSKQDACP